MKRFCISCLMLVTMTFIASSQKWTYFLEGKGINDITEDKKGNIWTATYENGAYQISGKEVKEFSEKNGLSWSSLKAVYIDSKNNVWIGTGKTGITADGKGISIYDGTKWKYYTEKDGLASNAVFSFFEDSKGRMWCGTAKGVCLLKGDKWETMDAITPARFTAPNFFEDKGGNVWFMYEGGIFKYDGKEVKAYDENSGLAIKQTLCWTIDKDGTIWFGHVRRHFSKFRDNKFETFDVGNFNAGALWLFRGSYLYEPVFVYSDSGGLLWIAAQGSGGGLFNLKNGELTNLSEKEEVLKASRINGIYEDTKGNLWFSNLYKGANRFDGTKWYDYTPPELPHKQVNKILIDSKGNIWFGTHKGLAKLEQ